MTAIKSVLICCVVPSTWSLSHLQSCCHLCAVRVEQEPALNGNCSHVYYKQVSPPHLTIAFRWQVSRLSAKDTELCWVSEWRETKERCWCVHKCGAYGGAAPFIQMRPHCEAHVNCTCHRQYHSNNAATIFFLMLPLSEGQTGEVCGPADKAMLFVDIEEHWYDGDVAYLKLPIKTG